MPSPRKEEPIDEAGGKNPEIALVAKNQQDQIPLRGSLNIYVILRVIIGIFFVVVSTDKLLGPYQNFLYVIEKYEFLPRTLEEIAARFVPWAELFLGLFLALGLWLKRTITFLSVLVTAFICIVTQAVLRSLPIDECGCFGEMFSMPLKGILILDSLILFTLAMLLNRIRQTSALSLDRLYEKP